MKVRDLIAGSTFTPGAGRSGPAPRVSYILPTFRRGDDGLLRRAIDSLLGQSFDDLEIIVVDDASTDSTAAVIAEVMRLDPRVSVIRHERNIGLPAVSEYEAYMHARGDLIAFAFDDTVIYRHGLRRLVLEADRHPDTLVAGWVNFLYRDGSDGTIRTATLGQNNSESNLLSINHIPNIGVLMPRSVLEVVGLYDPHILLARICDYDLWRRARRRVPITFVSMCIGEEHGPAISDSLGFAYVLDHWAADDRMRQSRDEMLTPARFHDVDVFDVDGLESERSRDIVRGLAEGHRRTHEWMTAPAAVDPPQRVPRVLVVTHPIDASVQLVFEALRDVPGLHVRMIDPSFRNIGELGPADVLIVTPGVSADWAQVARLLGIPAFCYLDENLPLMAAARELEGGDSGPFAIGTLRATLAPLDGVLTGTEALAQSLRDQRLHRSVQALRLSIPSFVSGLGRRPPPAVDGSATIALFLRPDRLTSFRRILWPALVEAGRRTGRPIRLLVPQAIVTRLRRLRDERVTIEPFVWHDDYFSTMRELRMAGAEALVVPPVKSVNTPYTTLHPFATATILDAVLVAPASDPYLELSGEERVQLVERPVASESWADAIVDVLSTIPPTEPGVRSLEPFAPAEGAAHLLAAVGARVPEREPDNYRRALQVSDWLATQLFVTRSIMNGMYAATSSRGVAPMLTNELYDVVRRSRRVNAFRVSSTPLSAFGDPTPVDGAQVLRRRERAELSVPLASVSYVSYRMVLPQGRYQRVLPLIWSDGDPGDVVGIEIVDPGGRICLHAVAALPRKGDPVHVAVGARGLNVTSSGTYELRVFARTERPAHVLEVVDRGVFGLRRPRVRPMVRFDPYPDATPGAVVRWLP